MKNDKKYREAVIFTAISYAGVILVLMYLLYVR
jgi:hypothetical protein